MAHIDPELIKFATPRQVEYIELINELGSGRAVAERLGIHYSAVNRGIAAVKAKAALGGYSPNASNITATVPEGFAIKRLSARFDKEGKPAGGWQISEPNAERREQMVRAFVESIVENAGKYTPMHEAPTHGDEDLLTVYPLGDPHFGLYSWHEETGENFDINEADRITRAGIDRLVSSAPKSKEAILLNLGDFYHANDSKNATPGHGHGLDVDTRYENVMRVGVDSLIHCTYRLLEKHEKVTVWNVKGNHDPEASFALSLAMWHHFKDEPRITINLKPADYLYYRFGKCLIGSHHGHGAKAGDLPLLMASDRPEDWGATTFRVWHCGHIHHRTRKEHPGCEVETHNTLAAKDAWHNQKGYRSRRECGSITYHREYGEVQRVRIDVGMLAA